MCLIFINKDDKFRIVKIPDSLNQDVLINRNNLSEALAGRHRFIPENPSG
jgi:hypothetical protein